MRITLLALLINFVFSITPLVAQPTKPMGVWDLGPTCANAKAWMSFSMLAAREDFEAARKCSERTGITWVIQFGFDDPLGTPVDAEIIRVQQKLTESGLSPHVIGMSYVEEWYGLTNKRTVKERDDVREFGALQHDKLKAAFPGKLLVYVDALVNDNPAYGIDVYHPLPRGVDVFAMEYYQRREDDFDLFFQYVKAAFPTLPIALVGNAYYDPRFPESSWKPTRGYTESYRRYLNDPRVIAGILFTWRDRPWVGMQGLESWPDVQAWFVQR